MKLRSRSDYDLIIGIDSSVHNVGVSIYIDIFEDHNPITRCFTFKDCYSLLSLFCICSKLEDEVFSQYTGEKRLVVIEEPLLPIKFSRSISQLNQIAGALAYLSHSYGFEVMYIHNRTVKSLMGFKSKDESVKVARKLYPHLRKVTLTDHESDAVLLVEAFYMLERSKNESKGSENLGVGDNKCVQSIRPKSLKKQRGVRNRGK